MNNPIRIFDSSLNLVTELDDYASAYFNRSWSGCGDFSIQTNYNTVHAPDLVRGRIVMFDKNVKKCGIITNVKKAIGESGKGSMIVTASGIELKGILSWRIVPPTSGSEYYTINNSAETVMKTLVSQNGGPTDADADRIFPLLEIDTDADLGATYLLKTRYTSTVLAECTACSLATETGFYIYLDLSNKKYRFQTAQGVDRSASQSVNPRAIFSTDYDTLKSADIDDNDSNYRNYAFVGGQGEGVERIVREVFTGATEPTGLDRREMFVDARDVPALADLDTRGGQKLEELATIITVDGSPLAYSPLVYGTDYDLGDIATLEAYDNTTDVRITSVKESWAPLSYNIDMTFDRLPQTLQTQVQSAVSSIKNSVASVGVQVPVPVAATTYTVTDAARDVMISITSAVTVTISEGLPIGTETRILRTVDSTNAVTVARSGSETINGAVSLAFTLGISEITFKKVSATNWELVVGAGIVEIDGNTGLLGDGNVVPFYEAGTWTPTYKSTSGALGAITYNALTFGKYVQIGNLVHVWGYIITDALAVGTASGVVRIAGLPFVAESTYGGGSVSYSAAFAANNPCSCFVVLSTSEISLGYRATANGITSHLPVAALATGVNSNILIFSAIYSV